jgi:hypothetical protein
MNQVEVVQLVRNTGIEKVQGMHLHTFMIRNAYCYIEKLKFMDQHGIDISVVRYVHGLLVKWKYLTIFTQYCESMAGLSPAFPGPNPCLRTER